MQDLILGRVKHLRLSLLSILCLYFLPEAQATLSVIETSESITIHVGSGASVSYLAFVEPSLNPKPVIYAWHYSAFTNTNSNPPTGLDLFNAVATETTGSSWALSYSTGAYGLTTSFTIGSISSTVVDPLSNSVWTYWIQGGSEFVQYGDHGSFTFLVGDSPIVSPAYWDTRYLEDGSYDIWSINPYSYTGAPSDTHEYTDVSGQSQTVTFGTYGGSAPVLKTPPKVLSSRILSDGNLEVVFAVVEGGVYQLQEQEGLAQNGWSDFDSPFIATTSQKTFTLAMNNSSQRGFFRLVRKE